VHNHSKEFATISGCLPLAVWEVDLRKSIYFRAKSGKTGFIDFFRCQSLNLGGGGHSGFGLRRSRNEGIPLVVVCM
jgi:hypothetical protein